MDTAILDALIEHENLTRTQVRGIAEAVAVQTPKLLLKIAERDDLDAEFRPALIQAAPARFVTDLLDRWSPEESLMDIAVEAHGATPDLVVWCGKRGWFDRAVQIAVEVAGNDAEFVASRWQSEVDSDLSRDMTTALIRAVLTDEGSSPSLQGVSESEQLETMECSSTRHAA